MRIEQGMPVTIADLRRPARWDCHDVGEKHCGEHTVVRYLGLVAGGDFVDLLEGRAPWLNEVVHVAPR